MKMKWAASWENRIFAYAKSKPHISCYCEADFAARIVQFLYVLNPKFQASYHLLLLYRPVCVRPSRKPQRPVFSQRGSNEPYHEKTSNLQIWIYKYENKGADQLRSMKLISAYVFATWIVKFLYFLHLKFLVSNHFLCLYSLVCVRPVWKPR